MNFRVMLQKAVYEYAFLPLVLMSIENQNVNCQVASVEWWHNKNSMTLKIAIGQVFLILLFSNF